MNAKFKVGDIVNLKSGGPPMTITEVDTVGPLLSGKEEPDYTCAWFAGSKQDTASFPEAAVFMEDYNAAVDSVAFG